MEDNNIKCGYPNPNYTEDDIMTEEAFLEETGMVCVDLDHYDQLVTKAAMFDCISSTIKSMGKVEPEVLRALTGTLDPKENAEIEQYRNWWHSENEKNTNLVKQNEILREQRDELQRKLSEAEDLLNDLHRDDPNWPPKDDDLSDKEVTE